jgi:hypothetical protein
MASICPNEGEIQLLTELLSSGENWTLKLFKSDTTPSETDTAATYTEADFTGYAAKTLTRSVSGTTWSTPAGTGSELEAQDAKSSYNSGSPQTWNATSAQDIHGYIFVGATSGKLVKAERYASTISLVNPSTTTLVPVMELA